MSMMPEIPELSVVRLTEAVEGIEAGSYGTVVHVYQGSPFAEAGYAVEFSNPSRVVVVARSQIEPEVWTEEDLPAADAKAEELHRYFHPEEYTAPPAVVDHTERANKDDRIDQAVALFNSIQGKTQSVAIAEIAAALSAVASEIERLRADLKRVGAGWEAVEQARHNLTLMLQDRDARLARLQDPDVREAVIDALLATTGWVSSFEGELRLAAAALTDAAIAKIKEMLK